MPISCYHKIQYIWLIYFGVNKFLFSVKSNCQSQSNNSTSSRNDCHVACKKKLLYFPKANFLVVYKGGFSSHHSLDILDMTVLDSVFPEGIIVILAKDIWSWQKRWTVYSKNQTCLLCHGLMQKCEGHLLFALLCALKEGFCYW